MFFLNVFDVIQSQSAKNVKPLHANEEIARMLLNFFVVIGPLPDVARHP
jgi:hypothetical protein